MLTRTIGLLLLMAVGGSVYSVAAETVAETRERGYIIRAMDHLVFIDLGRRDGVEPDDLFDVVAHEVVSHPVSGDTMGVSRRSVGAVRVRQVEDKLAVAEILHLQRGQNPYLMRIQRITSDERRAEVERLMRRSRTDGVRPSRLTAVVPGLYQLRQGQLYKGMVIMGLEAAALATGIGYRISSNEWYEQYEKLPSGHRESEYDRYFVEANRRRTRSNRFFWLAGGVYAYHLIDLFWAEAGSGSGWAHRPSESVRLHAGVLADGTATVRLSRRF